MNFLPYESFVIQTYLSQEQALERLEEVVEPPRVILFSWPARKDYVGKIEGSRFSLSPVTHLRGSFGILIKGDVWFAENGSSISITIRLPHFVPAFLSLWILLEVYWVVSFLMSSAVDQAFSRSNPLAGIIPLFLILALGYADFRMEAARSKAFFERLFEAESVEDGEPAG